MEGVGWVGALDESKQKEFIFFLHKGMDTHKGKVVFLIMCGLMKAKQIIWLLVILILKRKEKNPSQAIFSVLRR